MLAGLLFLSSRSSIPPRARGEVLPPLLVFPGGHRRRHSPSHHFPVPVPVDPAAAEDAAIAKQHVGRIQGGQLRDLLHAAVRAVEGAGNHLGNALVQQANDQLHALLAVDQLLHPCSKDQDLIPGLGLHERC